MGGSQSVSVNIALDKAAYCAGETVKGYADVAVLKDGVVMPDLTMSLSGVTVTRVRYRKTTGSGKNRKTEWETARSHHTFLMVQSKVGNLDGQLGAGAHLQIPFEFAIPVDAISTCPLFTMGRNMCRITYYAGVSASKPGVFFGTSTTWLARVPVDVMAAPPLASPPPRLEQGVNVMRCCCIPAGAMRIAAAASASSIKAGDELSVTAEVDNQTSQAVEYVDVSVVRYIQFSARGHRKANQRVVATFRSAPGIGPGDKFGFDGVERPRTMALSIPALQYFTTNTRNVHIKYFVVVKAKTESSFVRDPEIHLDLATYRLGPAVIVDAVKDAVEVDGDGDDDGGVDDDKDDDVIFVTACAVYNPDPSKMVHVIEPSAIFVVDEEVA